MASCRKDWKGAAPFLGEHLGFLREDFSFSGYERDLVCLNRGDGTFLDISGASGADSVTDGRAAVFADFYDDVRAKTSAVRIVKLKSGGAGFLAQHDPRVLIGLGDDEQATEVEIVWPSGAIQRVGSVPAGTTIRVRESGP